MANGLVASTLMVAPGNVPVRFQGTGGTEPYTYSIEDNQAGGFIDEFTGMYFSPASLNTDPAKGYDTILATDLGGQESRATIFVGTPVMLLADIIRSEMGLSADQVYAWNQKINIPTDEKIYIAVSNLSCKPFGNSNKLDESGFAVQSVNMLATMNIDIFSRNSSARDRKEEVILALLSDYAQTQQEVNSFYLAKISSGFTDLSQIDGPAIPYRFNISVNMQYTIKKTKAVPYFGTFRDVSVSQVEP